MFVISGHVLLFANINNFTVSTLQNCLSDATLRKIKHLDF